jgi:phosphoglycerate dehydrogenase-like enzyme
MYKVVVLSPLPEGLVRMFFAEYLEKYSLEAEFVCLPFGTGKEELERNLEDADIVIGDYTMRVKLTSGIIEHMKKVKLVAQPSTGYDHIDIAACREKGIPVSNVGGANSVSVAEHTIALALALMRRITYANNSVLEGKWVQDDLMNTTYELSGKIWGIVGMGRIGREVAFRACNMGSKIIYYDINKMKAEEEAKYSASPEPFSRLLAISDVVSVHIPLNDSTRGMFGEKEFRTMRPSSIFINVSRGGLVDENALARALMEGWIAGAGIDVFSSEPPDVSNPIIVAAKAGANIILTPHIAGATNDSRIRIIQTTVENVVRVMLGQKPENVVNP